MECCVLVCCQASPADCRRRYADHRIAQLCLRAAVRRGHQPFPVARHDPAQSIRQDPNWHLIDLGLRPSRTGRTKVCPDQRSAGPLAGMKILVLSGQNDEDNARHARTLVALTSSQALRPGRLTTLLRQTLIFITGNRREASSEGLIGDSLPIQRLRPATRADAKSGFPVLIEGESGSGKTSSQPLPAPPDRNAAEAVPRPELRAISPTLLEPTLFGYAKGFLTGASSTRPLLSKMPTPAPCFRRNRELPPNSNPNCCAFLETWRIRGR